MANTSSRVSVHWFRKGLRVHDNPALLEACRDANHVYPIFVLDPHFLQQQTGSYKVGVNRYNFLLESLTDLDNSLKALGSRLLVIRGQPEEMFPRLFKDWGVTDLCYEVDTEPYAKTRDAAVVRLATAAGVRVRPMVSHTLYDTDMLVAKNGGKAPLTMGSFTKLLDKIGDPPAPLPAPSSPMPSPAPGAPGAAPADTRVPTWSEVGFKEAPTTPFKGGETEGLRRLEASMADPKWVCAFQKPETDPSAFEKPATTTLSPYLKFGCVSARLFHARLLEVYRAAKGQHTQPPVSLRGQLLWREFNYTVGASTPNFNRMVGNPLCRQLPWVDDPVLLEAWTNARTGFPWIDALMTQLREWGWMHHLGRHSVACFLTRGDLYVSWEAGQAVFEELLVDQDHYVNAFNWMWLSASAFFHQYFRVYSPVTFGKKYDKEGRLIRRFLPVLANMPAKYIYEPWLAPLEVQKKAGCIIGVDYPRPIVNHAEASKLCISRMAAGYAAHKAAAGGGGGDGDTGDDGGAAGASTSSPPAAAAAFAKTAKKGSRAMPKDDDGAGKGKGGGGKRQKTLLELGVTNKQD